MRSLFLKSSAKVNLGLHVLKKREDGFHDIETVFQEIDLHDDIELVETETGISVETDSPLLSNGPENLAWKAADLILRHTGKKTGILIRIRKRIPVSGGLGGGSSNAAAVLSGLNSLCDLKLPKNLLLEMAGAIGSDAPFFLYGNTAIATGRGEVLRKVSLQGDCYFVLINPGIEVSTAWAYGQVRPALTKNGQKNIINTFSSSFKIKEIASQMRNDLEKGVISKFPVIATVKEMLERGGAVKALMSGSGATVFGVFQKEKEARIVIENAKLAGWTAFFTRPVYSPRES
ncbi:MAG: 4-(cytidine 5'-diphospho)-2-C-methyl-D-erythritol kinase [Nitrospinota bacterium]